MYKKIITHAGVFHADEVLAIATFMFFTKTSPIIERRFQVSAEELEDAEILIIDVGRVYDPAKGNFDHHQNPQLPASNVLVLNHFSKSEGLNKKLREHLFEFISDVDKGVIPGGGDSWRFNGIIRNLNSLPENDNFNTALMIARQVLESFVITAEKAIEGEAAWKTFLQVEGKPVKVDLNGRFIPDWKSLAEREGILLLVSPNARGGWQVVSRDSNLLNIPAHESQTFRHESGFMAVYKTQEVALFHACSIV